MKTKNQQYQERREFPVQQHLLVEQVIEKQSKEEYNGTSSGENIQEYSEYHNVCIRLVQIHHPDKTNKLTRIPLYRNVLLHFDIEQKPYQIESSSHHNLSYHNDKN